MNARHRSRIFRYGPYSGANDSSKTAEAAASFEQIQPSTKYRPACSTTRLVGVITLGFLTMVGGGANPSSDTDGAEAVTEEESVARTLSV